MKKSVCISVVVPIYGVEKYLRTCVDSIISQTYDNLEIILVDDGSKDLCGNICDYYAKKDSRIKVIHKTNGGIVSARKIGLDVASNDYLMFVDGDDYVHPDCVKTLVDNLNDKELDIVSVSYFSQYGNGRIIPYNEPIEGIFDRTNIDSVIIPNFVSNRGDYSSPYFGGRIWGRLFRCSFIKEHITSVSNNISYGDDASVLYSMIPSAKKICIVNTPLYYYRINSNSMTNSYNPRQLEGSKYLIDRMVYLKSQYDSYDMYTLQIDYYIINILIMNYINEGKNNEGKIFQMNKQLNELSARADAKNIIKFLNFENSDIKTKLLVLLVKHNLGWIITALKKFK